MKIATQSMKNRMTWILVLMLYWLVVVLPHEQVGLMISKVSESMSRRTYNLSVVGIAVAALGVLVLLGYRRWRVHPYRTVWSVYFLVTLGLTWGVSYYLMIVQIELVHVFQYAIFAVLCYRVVPQYGLILAWTILVGAMDELYQYLILSPERTEYFDLNDVLINTVGGLWGVLVLSLWGQYSERLSHCMRAGKVLVGVSIFLMLGVALGIFTERVCYEPGETCVFVLFKVFPDAFWTIRDKGTIVYHILRLWEYVIISGGIWIAYIPLLRFRGFSR